MKKSFVASLACLMQGFFHCFPKWWCLLAEFRHWECFCFLGKFKSAVARIFQYNSFQWMPEFSYTKALFSFLTCCVKIIQKNLFTALCWASSEDKVPAFCCLRGLALWLFFFFFKCWKVNICILFRMQMQRYIAEVHNGVKFSGLALQIASGHTGVWSNMTGNRASGLDSGLSPWDKVVLTVPASSSFCYRHPYNNCTRS